MEKLIYDFEGMKDATKEYTTKMNQWEAEADTMKSQLEQLLYDIKLDSINNDVKKTVEDQQKFMLLRQKFYTYQQDIDSKAKEEDQKMTTTVMSQLEEYIEKYGEKFKYDLIITNTQFNNVAFANKDMDITTAVLTYVNRKYQGE